MEYGAQHGVGLSLALESTVLDEFLEPLLDLLHAVRDGCMHAHEGSSVRMDLGWRTRNAL